MYIYMCIYVHGDRFLLADRVTQVSNAVFVWENHGNHRPFVQVKLASSIHMDMAGQIGQIMIPSSKLTVRPYQIDQIGVGRLVSNQNW